MTGEIQDLVLVSKMAWYSILDFPVHLRLRMKWSEGKSLSRVWLFATAWTVAYQAPPSLGFPRQEYWSGLPLPSLVKNTSWTANIPHKNWWWRPGWGGFCLSSELSLPYEKQGCNSLERSVLLRMVSNIGTLSSILPSKVGVHSALASQELCDSCPEGWAGPLSGAMCVKPRYPFLQVESIAPGHRWWAGLQPEEVPKVQPFWNQPATMEQTSISVRYHTQVILLLKVYSREITKG